MAAHGGRLSLAAIDLAWLTPCSWVAASLAGVDATRAALAVVPLYGLGAALSAALSLRPPPPLVGNAAALLVALMALAFSLWAALYAPLPPLDAAWASAALTALRDSPFRFPADIVVLVAGALFYWRGSWLFRVLPDRGSAGASFQVGLVALALAAWAGGGRYGALGLGWTFAYLAVGLLALAAARGRELGLARDAGARAWSGIFTGLLLVGALTLVGAGLWLAPSLVAAAVEGVDRFLAALHAFMLWLAHLFGPHQPPPVPVEPQPGRSGEMPSIRQLLEVPEVVRRVGGALVLIGMALPLIHILLRFLAEAWRRLWEPFYVADVSVERWQGEGAGLRDAVRRLLWRLGRLLWRGAGGRPLDGDPRGWPVRLAYRNLLRAGAKRGAPRPAAATAAEHLEALRRAFPDDGDDLVAITRAYERARYGAQPQRVGAAEVRLRCRRVLRRRWPRLPMLRRS